MRRARLIPPLLVLVTLATFWPVVGHDFVDWDDDVLVWENPALAQPTPAAIRGFWRELNPLTNTLYALLALVPPTPGASAVTDALNPQAFHAANLALHVLAVLVVFGLLRSLVGHPWAAAAGALLFGLHPVQVEPVAWVTGLRDVLSGLCVLAALRLHLRFARPPAGNAHGGRGSASWAAATLFFALALLAKPTAVVAPVLALTLDRCALGRPWRAVLPPLLPWCGLAVGWGVLTKAWQPDAALVFVTPLWARPLVAVDALVFYLRTLAVPVGLGPDYGRTPAVVLEGGWPYLSALAIWGLGLVGTFWTLRRTPLLVPAALFVGALLPVLGLMAFLFQLWSTVADRYLYVAMLGPALATAHLLARHGRRVVGAAAALLLTLLALGSHAGTAHWRDSHTLFTRMLAINPRSWTAHHNLGYALRREGRTAEAIDHLMQAVRLKPDLEWAHELLAGLLMDAGRVDELMAHWAETLRAHPEFARGHYGMAIALAARGRPDEARAHYREALRLRPDWVEAHYNLANLLAAENRLEEAIAHYREALRLRPDLASAHSNLGVALGAAGRREEAMTHYREALRLEPDLVAAHHNLANALLDVGRPADAIDHYRAVLRVAPGYVAAQQGLQRALAAAARR
jgi:tetratricopeptide (TPR) repeat protein